MSETVTVMICDGCGRPIPYKTVYYKVKDTGPIYIPDAHRVPVKTICEECFLKHREQQRKRERTIKDSARAYWQ